MAEVSRFSCMQFLSVPGVYDYAGPHSNSRYCLRACCLPQMCSGSAPPNFRFSKLNTLPAGTPIYASTFASRRLPQNSGPGWFATPFLQDSFIPYCMPVDPGARTFCGTVRSEAAEHDCLTRRNDQTVRPIARSLRGRGGAATIRLKPSDNVPTTAKLTPEPRGNGVSASIKAERA